MAKQRIPYVDLGGQYAPFKEEVMAAVEKVIDSGWFILGQEVKEFEQKFAALCGTKYAIGMNSGTDALILCMNGLGIGKGDEVIVPPNSYLASASSVALAGATPVFADVRDDYNLDPEKLEQAITPKTKAVIPVHLTGRPADMHAIQEVADRHGLYVLEDAAQAVGATYHGQTVGSFGIAAGFSLHPLKNLSAAGDAGITTTDNEELYEYLMKARTHGHRNREECAFWSLNSRLDTMQAAILLVKMKYLDQWNKRRRELAEIYQERLSPYVWVPKDQPHEHAVYHTFIIQTEHRDALQRHLNACDIDTKIHYPIPIHLQESAEYLGYKKGDFPITERQTETILSLPIFAELTDEQVQYVCECIQIFFDSKV
ncbi:MAG: DegT/DnrJ/EryC1/StrS family aminotransferase [Bacteroidota bacterium]